MPDLPLALPDIFDLRSEDSMRRVVLIAAMLCHIRLRGVIVRCGGRVGAMAAGIVMMHVGVLRRRGLHCKRLSHAEADSR